MSKQTLIEKLHDPITPELQAVIDFRAKIQECRDKINAIAGYARELEGLEETARIDLTRDPTLQNFKNWLAIREKAKIAQEGAQRVYETSGHYHTMYTKDFAAGKEVLLPAIRVIRDRLAKEISRLNDDERKRLTDAGLDPSGGEHPAIAGLRGYLSQLAEALTEMPNYGDGSHLSPWDKWNSLIKV